MPRVIVGTENGTPIQLHYEDHGVGDPVVLVHGWPLSGRSWEGQVHALVDGGFRVITYDRRGFGASSQPWGGYDYDTMTADLDALMRHLDLHDATLVGFSMGGGEVARYLGRYGKERVSKVAFASAVTPCLFKSTDNPHAPLEDAMIVERQAGIRADRMAYLELFTHNFFTAGGTLRVSEPQRRFAYDLCALASPKATHDCVAAFGRTDFRADLAKIDVPALILHGDADAIVPVEVSGRRTAAAVAGSKLVIIAGGPHGINVSHATQFNEALLAFLG